MEFDEDGVAFPGFRAGLGVGSNGWPRFVGFGGVEDEFDRAGSF